MSARAWRFLGTVTAAVLVLPVACRPAQHAPERLPCARLEISGDAASLAGAGTENSGTLILAGQLGFACPCGAPRNVQADTEARNVLGDTERRTVRGDTEARSVQGDTEARSVRGDTEARGVRGDTEARSVRGDTEQRGVQGDTEQRGVQGDTEQRGVRGATETLDVSCTWVPECGGFSVSGVNVTQVFDGQRLVAASSSCVPPRR